MEQFIRLHNSDNNYEIVVNKDDIQAVMTFKEANNRLCSKVFIGSYCSIAPFIVNETPQLVINENDNEFITLHDATDNNIIIIRCNEISIIDTVITGSNIKAKLYFSGTSSELKPIIVHESPEKIRMTINKKFETM